MPRGPRLDSPGAIHHVRFRGIERRKIFITDKDRIDFLERLERSCENQQAFMYAWCLMDNHVHLAIRTGTRPLRRTLSSLLTGYAIAFNLRHKRSGHLFQNRYKSTVVEEEPYFLTLVRYIHRNPLRAHIVRDLDDLAAYPWSGHSVLMGNNTAPFQNTDEVLQRFGSRAGPARRAVVRFMGDPEAKGDERIFKGAGGGLVRSMGGLDAVRAQRQAPKWAHDERILGSGQFVARVLEQASEALPIDTLTEEQQWTAYESLVNEVCRLLGIDRNELLSGGRRRVVARARQVIAYVATRKLGLAGASVARTMRVSNPAIFKAALKGPDTLSDLGWDVAGLLRMAG